MPPLDDAPLEGLQQRLVTVDKGQPKLAIARAKLISPSPMYHVPGLRNEVLGRASTEQAVQDAKFTPETDENMVHPPGCNAFVGGGSEVARKVSRPSGTLTPLVSPVVNGVYPSKIDKGQQATVDVHHSISEAPCLRSSMPHTKTDFEPTENATQWTNPRPRYTKHSCFSKNKNDIPTIMAGGASSFRKYFGQNLLLIVTKHASVN